MAIPCSICGGQPCKEGCWTEGHVERLMADPLIQQAARAFADFRGRSGNFEALARSRAVDLFGFDEDSHSAAKRAAFKRLARQYAGRTVAA